MRGTQAHGRRLSTTAAPETPMTITDPVLRSRLELLRQTPMDSWRAVRAWEMADDRYFKRIGYDRAEHGDQHRASMAEYRHLIDEMIASRFPPASHGGTWSRRRFQRVRNGLEGLPQTVLGQIMLSVLAYPRSRKLAHHATEVRASPPPPF